MVKKHILAHSYAQNLPVQFMGSFIQVTQHQNQSPTGKAEIYIFNLSNCWC